MKELEAIKERVAAATPGPWRVWDDKPAYRSAFVETAWSVDGENAEPITDWCTTADAKFIAHAPTDQAKLIAALEAVVAIMSERQKLWDAICAETCLKDMPGVDHRAIADAIAANITQAITEALA